MLMRGQLSLYTLHMYILRNPRSKAMILTKELVAIRMKCLCTHVLAKQCWLFATVLVHRGPLVFAVSSSSNLSNHQCKKAKWKGMRYMRWIILPGQGDRPRRKKYCFQPDPGPMFFSFGLKSVVRSLQHLIEPRQWAKSETIHVVKRRLGNNHVVGW